MHTLFLITFILFYLLLHLWKGKSKESSEAYFVGGRKFGLFPLIATLVVSQYGWINGVFEMYLLDGPKAWFVLSLPYLVFNLLWVFLGKYFYQKKALTTPQLFRQNYGTGTGMLAAILLTLIFLPIMYVHMGASVLSHSFGLSFKWGAILFIFLASLSLFTGGFKRIVYTDIFLFFLTYTGLIATLLYILGGSLWDSGEFISSTLKVEIVQTPSKYAYVGWWLMALIVFIDPSIHQRLWASGSSKQVSKVMIGSILFWLFFDLLVIGIISKNNSLLPFTNIYSIAASLPLWINLLFNFMLLAVILSTANTYFNISYNNIAFDLLQLKSNAKKSTKYILAVLVMLLTYLLTVYIYNQASVIDILFQLFPVAISGLFIPFMSIFLQKFKIPGNWVLAQMLIAASVCLFFQINPLKWANFATEIPVAIGLLSSLVLQSILVILWQVQKGTKN